jgi:shikimate kinase
MASRIYLVGLMGSGKSYWGEKIAAHLGWLFTDLDVLITEGENMSIPDIFNRFGEEHFRMLERKYLSETKNLNKAVVAAGGGTPCFFDNLEVMNRLGESFYLKVKPETAAERLRHQTAWRPLLKGKSSSEIVLFLSLQLKEREPFYLQAHHVIDADGIEEAAMLRKFTAIQSNFQER